MIEDYWAHYYAEHGVQEEVEDEDFDLDAILRDMEDGDWEDLINA